jgi:hypothetical protein
VDQLHNEIELEDKKQQLRNDRYNKAILKRRMKIK